MNHPAFTQLRRNIDTAITFDDLDHARRCIAQGLELARAMGCSGEAMYFHAQAAIVDEEFKAAIGLLEQAIAFNPSDGAAYNDIALCMVETGRLEGVLEVFDKGIAVEGDYATIHHNKGWLLNKLGRPTEALACFKQALMFEPQRVVTWENMADAYEDLGRGADALDAYRKALSFLGASHVKIREQLLLEIRRLELEADRC
ncbi:MAG: tetratricopeptide repeat protein [Candidatus Omnitrophica bacterium]|nr:tetratricopeptide repeat protein [Candidatus Omnitrophota bacterium]